MIEIKQKGKTMKNKTNTGDRNTGDCNVGNCNAGNRNTGDYNTGARNTGDHNTGMWNAGDCNVGNCNVGDCNVGNCNVGSWNTGDRNTGYCNSITPDDCLIFNKPAKRSDWHNADKPDWMFVSLTEWVEEADMTDTEKEAYPDYVTTGGYLKHYTSLKHAYVEAWERASDEDKEKTFNLPNFDIEVFKEVFGFTPTRPSKKREVTLTLTDEQLKKIEDIINERRH